jgi:hypothetical protein
MSNKPRKHSERTNSWRGAQRSSHRAYKVQMERHLIVCEGTKTEPLYFTELKRALGPNNGRKIYIEPIGTGAHTTALLELAQDVCNSSFEEYSHVWVVYDLDDFSKEDFDQVAKYCKEISGKVNYHALWSNPCFELWLLLHFGFTSAAMNSQECKKGSMMFGKKNLGKDTTKTAMGFLLQRKIEWIALCRRVAN